MKEVLGRQRPQDGPLVMDLLLILAVTVPGVSFPSRCTTSKVGPAELWCGLGESLQSRDPRNYAPAGPGHGSPGEQSEAPMYLCPHTPPQQCPDAHRQPMVQRWVTHQGEPARGVSLSSVTQARPQGSAAAAHRKGEGVRQDTEWTSQKQVYSLQPLSPTPAIHPLHEEPGHSSPDHRRPRSHLPIIKTRMECRHEVPSALKTKQATWTVSWMSYACRVMGPFFLPEEARHSSEIQNKHLFIPFWRRNTKEAILCRGKIDRL